ncbi:AraC family transcriptional regulator, arabinose operon regulatory protein [Devosia sp. YR412]|uniref:helix-turn-helix domain-containing protein n=1 Tax=Devosia sp. YR412 TaxID=1881030 RepID=UPI0008B3EACE|nr:helix-turn-helix domain-containing protein [Devosia sp. YR412]SEQ05704.1 AraC family transcriptional regulator, arabinose operon regulatory protein [Devosia sp. YR412]
MPEITEAPYQALQRLLTGHFRETLGYRALRKQGVDDWLLIHTIEGRGRFGHPKGDLIVGPGDWVLLKPGTAHDYGVEASLERWELLWAHFQPRSDWLDWLNWPAVAPGLLHLHIADDGALAQQFATVHAQLNSPHRRNEALAMHALEAVLLSCDQHNPRAEIRQGDARIQRALDHIDRHLSEKLLIDDIAAAIGLSPSRLAHLFRAETGQTVQSHTETRRMQLATDLLRRTGFPIKQIAAQCGFESQFYFSQRFRRFAGLSPLAFRQARD